ncbi:MAG: hypothetical protein R3F03_08855 [Opitutaceae bacterium]
MDRRDKFIFWLWPAYEVKKKDPLISPWEMSEAENSELEEQEASLRADVAQVTQLEDFCKVTGRLAESEAKRRESIETKAGGIVQAAGIVTALFSAVPALSGRLWSATGWSKGILLVLFTVALVHLVMAIVMAVRARRIGAIYLPTADEAAEIAQHHREDIQVENAIMDIIRAKRNEGIIGMKANRLAAAESHFIRGLAAFALTLMVGLWLS